MNEKNEMLRQFLASIAYHASKALRDIPDAYPDYEVGSGVRTPKGLVHHITGVLTYAHSFFEHYDTTYFDLKSWDDEIQGFYDVLTRLDISLQKKTPREVSQEQLLQGPLSDAMAHIGQLLILRRLAGSPVPSENFIYANIKKGVLGPNQPDPIALDE